ncbi:MAG: YbaK/EbsC family protein [Candidatus Marinimicrobia bacterium]|nr:YbaK/EbsC family protein [Candidatus Neomarinimicrobiota bacterium]
MSISKRVKKYLDQNDVKYASIKHSKAYTAQEIASSSHIPGKDLAKTVVLKDKNDEFVLAVLPATDKVDLEEFEQLTDLEGVKLANENDFRDLFPDARTGAMAPFGNLYDMPTYVSKNLDNNHMITFNAGSHEELIRMPYKKYKELVQPKVHEFRIK